MDVGCLTHRDFQDLVGKALTVTPVGAASILMDVLRVSVSSGEAVDDFRRSFCVLLTAPGDTAFASGPCEVWSENLGAPALLHVDRVTGVNRPGLATYQIAFN